MSQQSRMREATQKHMSKRQKKKLINCRCTMGTAAAELQVHQSFRNQPGPQHIAVTNDIYPVQSNREDDAPGVRHIPAAADLVFASREAVSAWRQAVLASSKATG